MDKVKQLFESVEWKYARSMPKNPHWYIVRWDRPEMDELFIEVARYIRDNGYQSNFYRKKLTYLNYGPWKLWTMGSPIHDNPEESYQMSLAKIPTTYILNIAHEEGHGPDLVNPNSWIKKDKKVSDQSQRIDWI